ncbi:MAG: acylphosphatase [Candidatus Binataceae bacterium]
MAGKMADDLARVRIRVYGRVQGVFFRRSAVDEGESLGLTGYARNMADGGVEIVAEGRRKNLDMLIAWTHIGPRLAHVSNLTEEWSGYRGEFAGFTVR